MDLCPRDSIDVLNTQFNIYAKYIGSTYGRPMISLKQEKLNIKRIVDKYAKENRLVIPEIYFSPINMAKCAIISKSFKLDIDAPRSYIQKQRGGCFLQKK